MQADRAAAEARLEELSVLGETKWGTYDELQSRYTRLRWGAARCWNKGPMYGCQIGTECPILHAK
jgi:hypothetical protein